MLKKIPKKVEEPSQPLATEKDWVNESLKLLHTEAHDKFIALIYLIKSS